MKSNTDILFVINPTELGKVVIETHTLLTAAGAEMAIGDLFYLNDFQDQENAPEDIVEEAEVLDKVSSWPTGGWITYTITGSDLLVSFHTTSDFKVAGITMSIFSSEYYERQNTIDLLILKMHEKFSALRTIQGEDIFDYIKADDEIERVLNGIITGNYEKDLR